MLWKKLVFLHHGITFFLHGDHGVIFSPMVLIFSPWPGGYFSPKGVNFFPHGRVVGGWLGVWCPGWLVPHGVNFFPQGLKFFPHGVI